MNEGPMTATELIIKNKMYWEEKQTEFDRVFKKFFGDVLDRLMRIIHTRTILGPPSTLMEDSWDLICVAMVMTTALLLTAIFLHTQGVL